jgi:hypothetical protein
MKSKIHIVRFTDIRDRSFAELVKLPFDCENITGVMALCSNIDYQSLPPDISYGFRNIGFVNLFDNESMIAKSLNVDFYFRTDKQNNNTFIEIINNAGFCLLSDLDMSNLMKVTYKHQKIKNNMLKVVFNNTKSSDTDTDIETVCTADFDLDLYIQYNTK